MRSLVLAAAALALVAAAPALAAKKPAPPPPAAAAPGAAAPAPAKAKTKGTSKMGDCAHQWSAMNAADKGKYNDKAKGMKSKKGGSLSGYNVWTGECMKKA